MEALIYILGWGSPIGIGLFLLFLLTGMAVFFWGISQLSKANVTKK